MVKLQWLVAGRWFLIFGWLAYLAVMFYFTHTPLEFELGGRAFEIDISHNQLDKVLHTGSYLVLAAGAVFVMKAWGWWHPRWRWRLPVALSVWAVADELLQIPANRTADPLDWLADTVGATAGTFLALWLLPDEPAADSPSHDAKECS